MITKREAAVISIYTGFLLGSFSDMHALAEELVGGPVFTHQFGNKAFFNELKELSRPLFVALDVEK